MDSISFIENGLKIEFSIEKLPTINHKINEKISKTILEKMGKAIEKNASIGIIEEYTKIIKEKFPNKINDFDKILHYSMDNLKKSQL
ncbi:hypothetical protein ISS06_02405 [Patescibacteria group bacterium]|nr:hypothetical protein [Patescibacteria group bacterium]